MKPEDFQRKPILKQEIGKLNSLLGLKRTDTLNENQRPEKWNKGQTAASILGSKVSQNQNQNQNQIISFPDKFEEKNQTKARPINQLPVFSLGCGSIENEYSEELELSTPHTDFEKRISSLDSEKYTSLADIEKSKESIHLVDSLPSNTTISTQPFHEVKSQPIMGHHNNIQSNIHHNNIQSNIHQELYGAGNHSFSRPGVGIPTHHSFHNSSAPSHDTTFTVFDQKGFTNMQTKDTSIMKTGLRLRRQSSYTNTSTSGSTPSSSFIQNSYSSKNGSQDIPLHSLSINRESGGPISPTALATWSSLKIGIKKKNSISSPSTSSNFQNSQISQSPNRQSTTQNPFGDSTSSTGIKCSQPSNTFSPAASFMNVLNMNATFSVGSLEDDEYGVGDEIGDYTLTKEIGRGAFSKVFEAVTPIAPFFLQNQQDSSATLPYNLPNDQQINGVLYTVAVKVVLKTSSADDDDYPSEPNHRPSKGGNSKRENELDYLRQIDRETAIWSRLHHPFLLEMNEVIRLKDATIIISELASGGTLLSYIQKNGFPGLSENVCKHFYKQIADALSYLHLTVGIIHHDVKLENVLLTHDLQVKMCDFGFAVEVVEGRARDHEPNCPGLCCAVRNNLLVGGGLGEMISLSLQQPNSVANEKEGHTATGSLHYLAPEHLMPQTFVTKKEEGPMGEKGDIWAFGCILYAMITGTLPFCESFLPRLQISIVNGAYDHDRLDKVGVSSDVKLLIGNMLQKDWKIRYNIRECIQSSWVRSKY